MLYYVSHFISLLLNLYFVLSGLDILEYVRHLQHPKSGYMKLVPQAFLINPKHWIHATLLSFTLLGAVSELS